MKKDNMIKPTIVPITIPAIVPFVKWWNDKDDDELLLSDWTDGFNDDGAILTYVCFEVIVGWVNGCRWILISGLIVGWLMVVDGYQK